MTYLQGKLTGDYQKENYFGLFILLFCIAVFLTVRRLAGHMDPASHPRLCHAISEIGACTFGVYLLHILGWISKWVGWLHQAMLGTGMNQMVVCLILTGIIMVGCYVVVYLLRLIPAVRKVL